MQNQICMTINSICNTHCVYWHQGRYLHASLLLYTKTSLKKKKRFQEFREKFTNHYVVLNAVNFNNSVCLLKIQWKVLLSVIHYWLHKVLESVKYRFSACTGFHPWRWSFFFASLSLTLFLTFLYHFCTVIQWTVLRFLKTTMQMSQYPLNTFQERR